MSTAVGVDEFQALEQRVLRAVEIVKQEREARGRAEAETAALREQLAERTRQAETEAEAARAAAEQSQREIEEAKREIEVLSQERSDVRQRVEKLLSQMDELI
jgi:methyl-accepting chemotaxis protein